MITDIDGSVIELDYKGMYEQLSKIGSSYKEQLHAIIIDCVSLEFSINSLVKTQSKRLLSVDLEEWSKKPYISIITKLRALRLADLIDEELYKNLKILFKIRNTFAHEIPLPPKILESEFEALKDVEIDSDFVKNLPNDYVKFQLIVSYCFTKLLYISKKLDPTSVLDLEAIDDITTVEKV
jgi:hypothetical protein